MSQADYIAKLRKIRSQIRSDHINTVMAFPRNDPREELPQILSSYETIEWLDRIIAAEEAPASATEATDRSEPSIVSDDSLLT